MKVTDASILTIVTIDGKKVVKRVNGYTINHDGIDYNIIVTDNHDYVLQDKKTLTTIYIYKDLATLKKSIKQFNKMLIGNDMNLLKYIRELPYNDSTQENRKLIRAFKAKETRERKSI